MHKMPCKEKDVQHVYVGNLELNKNRKRQGRNLKKQNRKQLLKFMCEIGGGGIMMLIQNKYLLQNF